MSLYIPKNYKSSLTVRETESAIKMIKNAFEHNLCENLKLTRVSAPLFLFPESGLNDNLSGKERPVSFDVMDIDGKVAEIVHSLAKWKRFALKKYGYNQGEGLYTDMNAIRRDEELDNIHSLYVDQWDWEVVISKSDRTIEKLQSVVRAIYDALLKTEQAIIEQYPKLTPVLAPEISFITSQQLLDMYPNNTPKERESLIAKQRGAVFIMQIGDKLSNGESHDMRAPDYDDWSLNGDIMVWNSVLDSAFELSSMGIRVNEAALSRQLELAGCTERAGMEFHSALLCGQLPQSIGGGIGQSRLCMLLMSKAHIGEVQASVWSDEMIATCAKNGVFLL